MTLEKDLEETCLICGTVYDRPRRLLEALNPNNQMDYCPRCTKVMDTKNVKGKPAPEPQKTESKLHKKSLTREGINGRRKS